jgi:hypothetical protein
MFVWRVLLLNFTIEMFAYDQCSITQAITCWLFTAEAQLQSQTTSRLICGTQGGTGASFTLGFFSFPLLSTVAPYSSVTAP